MPVSVVVGGQYGSEGKGKVALEIVRRDTTVSAVVRVGGSNSGHTGIRRRDGKSFALRQIPAAAIDGDVVVVLPPGAYIDVDVLLGEIEQLGLTKDQLYISPMAHVIRAEHKSWETDANLVGSIGSTGSGTGAAVMARIARNATNFPLAAVKAEEVPALEPFVQRDTTTIMRDMLQVGRRIVVEGSQGFGLSLLHSQVWPKATSRDTTAAAFISEAGLSPLDVDDVTLVLRAFPIRVAGDSGPLRGEISWTALAGEYGLPPGLGEYTTVTRKMRRVGRFDPDIVRQAMAVNHPNRIVVNHLDYIDPHSRQDMLSNKIERFLSEVEGSIGQRINWAGLGPDHILDRNATVTEQAATDLIQSS